MLLSTFSQWYGAFSPPARMLVPIVPLLAIPLALAVRRWRSVWFRLATALLLLVGWWIAHLLLVVPRLRFNLPDGESELLKYLSALWHVDLVGLLPSFILPSARSYLWAAGACALLYATWQLLARGNRSQHPGAPAELPATQALPTAPPQATKPGRVQAS